MFYNFLFSYIYHIRIPIFYVYIPQKDKNIPIYFLLWIIMEYVEKDAESRPRVTEENDLPF